MTLFAYLQKYRLQKPLSFMPGLSADIRQNTETKCLSDSKWSSLVQSTLTPTAGNLLTGVAMAKESPPTPFHAPHP